MLENINNKKPVENLTSRPDKHYNNFVCPCQLHRNGYKNCKKHPRLFKDNKKFIFETWDYKKNKEKTPCEIVNFSTSYWWLCQQGHSFKKELRHHIKNGCKTCAGQEASPTRNLCVLNPSLARELDEDLNGNITGYLLLPQSEKKVWWRCNKGHVSYLSTVCNRSNGRNCPRCSGTKMTLQKSIMVTHPHLADRWCYDKNVTENGVFLLPSFYGKGSGIEVYILCECGSKTKRKVSSWVKSLRCTECISRTTIREPLVRGFIKIFFPDASKIKRKNDRRINGNKFSHELDIYIPKYNVGIEIDGRHHADNPNDLIKNKSCEMCGIFLIRVTFGITCDYINNIKWNEKHDNIKNFETIYEYLINFLVTNDIIPHSKFEVLKKKTQLINNKNNDIISVENEVYTSSIKCRNIEPFTDLMFDMWDYERNGGLDPKYISCYDQRKSYWKCVSGHEWKQSVRNRKAGGECPICDGRMLRDSNSFSKTHPDLAAQMDNPICNNEIKSHEITKKYSKKINWTCGKEDDHVWSSRILERLKGTGCPFCAGQRADSKTCIDTSRPDLLKYWDYKKNIKNNMLPTEVMPGSPKEVWWKCTKGHEWRKAVSEQANRNHCYSCRNHYRRLCVIYPKMKEYWDFEKNKEVDFYSVLAGSGKECWWLCSNKHSWYLPVIQQVKNNNCPRCKIEPNLLIKKYPEVSKLWCYEKNEDLNIEGITSGSEKIVWWECVNGHIWQLKVCDQVKRKNPCNKCVLTHV